MKGEPMRTQTRTFAILAGVIFAAGCSEPNTTPTTTGTDEQREPGVNVHGTNDAGATVSWTELAVSLTERAPVGVSRMYAYLGMAQYQAARAAEGRHPERLALYHYRQ